MIDPDGIRQRYAALSSILDERGRRLLVAAEAKAAGYGGIAAVWRATGVATSTIGRGLRELAEAPALYGWSRPSRRWRPQAGRRG